MIRADRERRADNPSRRELDRAERFIKEMLKPMTDTKTKDIDFADLPRDPLADPFIGAEEKEVMARAGQPFTIIGVQAEAEGQYGPRWIVSCFDEWDAPFKLSFKMGGARDSTYEQLARTTGEGSYVRNVYLHQRRFTTNEGEEITFYVLAKSPQMKQGRLE